MLVQCLIKYNFGPTSIGLLYIKGFKMVLNVLGWLIGGAAGIEFNSCGVDFIGEIFG